MADDGTYQSIADAGRALIAATAGFVAALEQPPPPPPVPVPPVKAFPTAEGFGASALGGRGDGTVTPRILWVTNVNDAGPGSLRAALTATGPRFILFDVAGYITLASPIKVTEPYFYLAGQTSPGGICLRNAPGNSRMCLEIGTHDFVIRHIRARPGDATTTAGISSSFAVSLGIYPDRGCQNFMVDHCTFGWGSDACVEVVGDSHDGSIQWCIIAEGFLNTLHPASPHARGLNFQHESDGCQDFSVHHNLMGHVQFRVPQISNMPANGGFGGGRVEVVNNVVHHTTQMASNVNTNPNGLLCGATARFDSNYYKRTATTHREIRVAATRLPETNLYVHGNIGPSRPTDSDATTELNVVKLEDRGLAQSTDPTCGGHFPHPCHPVTATSAQAAYDTLVPVDDADIRVGAYLPALDSNDLKLVRQARTGTGGTVSTVAQAGGWPTITPTTPPADTNRDGLPDGHPDDSYALATAANGYLHLENYLNALAGDTIP